MRLKDVKGVGDKTLDNLNLNNIFTIDDLVFSFPKNYLIYEPDFINLYSGNYVYIEGRVDSKPTMFRYRGKAYAFSFYLYVNERRLKVNYYSNLYSGIKIQKDNIIGIYGKFNTKDKFFSVKKLFTDKLGAKVEVEYKYKDILDSTIQKAISNALATYEVSETLPQELIDKYKLLGIKDYIRKSHLPETKNDCIEVMRRRKYEECFFYSMSFDLIRYKTKKELKEPRIIDASLLSSFKESLKYDLTLDQEKAISEITNDIKNIYPMNRLIQGDVGCGKTVVAAYSILATVKSGFQAALMAPTEVLAKEHFDTLKNMLSIFGVKVELLTGSKKQKEKEDILYRLLAGRIDLLIGTHSLIYDSVIFKKLGLAVIDEQHRFGVKQRLKLIDKFKAVDSLYLSATPIPRTLGLTIFSDLDITSIKTMPKNRIPIVTKIIDRDNMEPLFKSIRNHLDLGEQAFVVVPLVEENTDIDSISISECEELFKSYFNDNIGVIHGKMKTIDKDKAINDFRLGKTNILISTTVIEVGINIPNATMMIIMDSDRFGLSTLHQLRGRVGRSNLKSYCMLVTKNVLNERLIALEENNDGFSISEIDFKLRGPGDYLGLEQSGFNLSFDLNSDINIFKYAKEDSKRLLMNYINGDIKSKKFDDILKISEEKICKIN